MSIAERRFIAEGWGDHLKALMKKDGLTREEGMMVIARIRKNLRGKKLPVLRGHLLLRCEWCFQAIDPDDENVEQRGRKFYHKHNCLS